MQKAIVRAAAVGMMTGVLTLVASASMGLAGTVVDTQDSPGSGEVAVGVRVVDLSTDEVIFEDVSTHEIEGNQGVVSIEAFSAEITEGDGDFLPLAVDGTEITRSITSKLYIQYSTRSPTQIRIEKVYGSWSGSLFDFWNRQVGYHDGVPGSNRVSNRAPTSNSFSYTTGWGWSEHYPRSNYSGAKAWSEVNYRLSGTVGSGFRQEAWVEIGGPTS